MSGVRSFIFSPFGESSQIELPWGVVLDESTRLENALVLYVHYFLPRFLGNISLSMDRPFVPITSGQQKGPRTTGVETGC